MQENELWDQTSSLFKSWLSHYVGEALHISVSLSMKGAYHKNYVSIINVNSLAGNP